MNSCLDSESARTKMEQYTEFDLRSFVIHTLGLLLPYVDHFQRQVDKNPDNNNF